MLYDSLSIQKGSLRSLCHKHRLWMRILQWKESVRNAASKGGNLPRHLLAPLSRHFRHFSKSSPRLCVPTAKRIEVIVHRDPGQFVIPISPIPPICHRHCSHGVTRCNRGLSIVFRQCVDMRNLCATRQRGQSRK